MPRRSSRFVPLACSLVAHLVAVPARAQEPSLDGMHGLGSVERHVVASPGDDDTRYTILIRVLEPPEGESRPMRLPTVYLLDGGITFPALSAYSTYLRLANEVPGLVLVGISYGAADFEHGNRRSRDYTAPSEQREHWGGIDSFLDLLESRVFPLVEARAPSDPTRRVLFGQSLGAQAAIYAAQFRPGLFWGHIASNPALHGNLALFLTRPATREQTDDSERPRLFVSSADQDDARFREPAIAWVEHWTSTPHHLLLETRTLVGHNHFSALPEAFRQGLLWLREVGLVRVRDDDDGATATASEPAR